MGNTIRNLGMGLARDYLCSAVIGRDLVLSIAHAHWGIFILKRQNGVSQTAVNQNIPEAISMKLCKQEFR